MTRDPRAETALSLCRGVRRRLRGLGFEAVAEFTPTKGLRADLCAVGPAGEIWLLEIKSCVADFRADAKWPRYLEWADRFYFVVDAAFPSDLAPATVGLFRADGFDAELERESPLTPLSPARRRALLLRFARAAAHRLSRLEDPGATRLETSEAWAASPGSALGREGEG